MGSCEVDPGRPATIAAALSGRFAATYGHAPSGCFAAPGRVNVIGEHLDYNDGRCLPMALPHATYVAVAPRTDRTLRVSSLQQEDPWAGTLDSLGPAQVTGWAAYPAGVVWAMAEDGLEVPGLDVMIDSRVPVGAGLSSSAALECAVAVAVSAVLELPLTDALRERLVAACVRAEVGGVGVPTGGMDQTVSLLARPGHALLLDCRDDSRTHVPWDLAAAGLELLVIDTRAAHALGDGGYAARRHDCERAATELGVGSLREVTDHTRALATLAELPGGRVRRRARHVFSELGRVSAALSQLSSGDYIGLGRTLSASHASLRDDFEVSCPELDTVVDVALAHGALGARMTGGGFGGSAIALVPTTRTSEVVARVAEAFATRGWPAPGHLLASPSAGAGPVS